MVIGLLAFATPAILVNHRAEYRLYAPLIPPPEAAPAPKPVPTHVTTVTPPPEPRSLKQFVAPTQPRLAAPQLEEAPALSKARRLELDLPAPAPAPRIPPPVQTGVFGTNLPPRADPVLPVPAVRSAAFDPGAKATPVVPLPAATAVGAFDTRSTETKPAAPAATIQTGAFDPTSRGQTAAPRMVATNVGRTAFDVQVDKGKTGPVDAAIRKTSFDEVKAVSAQAKPAASAAASMRPVEILEKPQPAYTAQARSQRVEGDVLLDVIFAATGEVRVLGVTRGLGYGLDENAVDAARRIRFHPATQAGMPVDQRVILHVVFQITG
ncbi:MAG: TonB family protein [Acidobacteriia bacterium]|nr:TonB family protein [Terriglobia bacterium]